MKAMYKQGDIVKVEGRLFKNRSLVVLSQTTENSRRWVIDKVDSRFVGNILESQILSKIDEVSQKNAHTISHKTRKALKNNGFVLKQPQPVSPLPELIKKVKQGDIQARITFFKIYKKKIW